MRLRLRLKSEKRLKPEMRLIQIMSLKSEISPKLRMKLKMRIKSEINLKPKEMLRQQSCLLYTSASDAKHPCDQGCVQSIGVFLDTIVICTLTAFVVIMGHV